MSTLTENWKDKLSQMLDRDPDQVDAFIKKKEFSFSDFLTLAQAVEDEDIDTVLQLFKASPDIKEADNPFASGSDLPTTPTTTPMSTTAPQRDVDNLTPGDKAVVRDLTGADVETTIKGRGPDNTYVVTGSEGDAVVKKDQILATPVQESFLSESVVDGLGTLRATLPSDQFRQDPPSITKRAIEQIYLGHQLPPRLSISIQPYIKMLNSIISDPTYRYRFINLVKLSREGKEPEPEELEVPDLEVDNSTEQKPVKTETTSAGAIASAPVAIGKPIKRDRSGVTHARSKKK